MHSRTLLVMKAILSMLATGEARTPSAFVQVDLLLFAALYALFRALSHRKGFVRACFRKPAELHRNVPAR
eukprot:6178544-Pleurochrysis_carterae.AAC.4